MTLLEVREQFIKTSGRWDLVVDAAAEDYSDNGADFYLQAGQDWLDRRLPFAKDHAEVVVSLTAGDTQVSVPRARAIKQVWLNYASDDVRELLRCSVADLRREYGQSPPFSSVDRSAPVFYAPVVLRSGSSPSTTTEGYTGIVVAPAATIDTTLTLRGMFLSEALDADAAVSFWTVVHPDILIQAAMLRMEELHRNSSGASDHRQALQQMISDIYADQVDSELPERDDPLHMSDPWRL